MRMTTFAMLVSGLALAACGGGGGGNGGSGSGFNADNPAGSEEIDASSIQEAIDDLVGFGVPGAAVQVEEPVGGPTGALQKTNTSVFVSGLANLGSRLPVSADLQIKLGGLSSLFIGTLAFLAEEDGLLDPEAPVAELLPEDVFNALGLSSGLKVSHLLEHRTGIPSYLDLGVDWDVGLPDADAALDLLAGRGTFFPAGADQAYSYSNYLLVALVLDQVLGVDHRIAIRDRILLPLALNSTFADDSQTGVGTLMSGYDVGREVTGWVRRVPGISMISTVGDLARFLHLLLNTEELISAGQRERLLGASPIPGVVDYRYGQQLVGVERLGVTFAGGGEFFTGYVLTATWVRETGHVIVMVSNDSSASFLPTTVNTRERIFDLVLQE